MHGTPPRNLGSWLPHFLHQSCFTTHPNCMTGALSWTGSGAEDQDLLWICGQVWRSRPAVHQECPHSLLVPPLSTSWLVDWELCTRGHNKIHQQSNEIDCERFNSPFICIGLKTCNCKTIITHSNSAKANFTKLTWLECHARLEQQDQRSFAVCDWALERPCVLRWHPSEAGTCDTQT